MSDAVMFGGPGTYHARGHCVIKAIHCIGKTGATGELKLYDLNDVGGELKFYTVGWAYNTQTHNFDGYEFRDGFSVVFTAPSNFFLVEYDVKPKKAK